MIKWEAVAVVNLKVLTRYVIQWNRVFLEKLTIAQLVKKSTTFH
jgi:hypothetical protein